MVDIRTKRLVMRRARMEDLQAIHGMLSDPAATRFWSTPPHTDIAQSEAWLRSMVEADPDESDDFCVELDGQVIGKLGCWELPEIGFLFDSSQWGKGYASEALGAFLDRRRALGSPNPITADVDPRNQASLDLLNRHGFVVTGRQARTWQIAGVWCDSVYLALRL
jgi:ribosomal-protein-alanine N-acetyltransferase